MKMTFAILFTVVGFATPALPNEQLARSLGVEPGSYSTTELIRLKAAHDEDDAARLNGIKKRQNSVRVSTKNYGKGVGHRQLSASVGVDPDNYTTAQVVQLRAAESEGRQSQASWIRGNVGGTTVANFSTRDSSISSGHRQMAASIGVDPARYSTAELIRMRHNRWSD